MFKKISKGRYNIVSKSARTYNGVVFDSAHEMKYCKTLDLLVRGGAVLGYERQVRYDIDINGKHICFYKLDFKVTYPDRVEYIDCKSTPDLVDPVYKLKKKLVEAIHGIQIQEVYQKP